jgi:hypothetical protein
MNTTQENPNMFVIGTLERFIELKRQEKDIQKQLTAFKDQFTFAADKLALENQSTQIEVSGALLFRRETRVFEYPKAILLAEAKLKAKKALFEEKNTPSEIRSAWVVKF